MILFGTGGGGLAREHPSGYSAAAYCPDSASLSGPNMLRWIERSFAAHDVMIAEVGALRNLPDPDPDECKNNLEYAVQRYALADEVGAKCSFGRT